jgi:hypothetical protein
MKALGILAMIAFLSVVAKSGESSPEEPSIDRLRSEIDLKVETTTMKRQGGDPDETNTVLLTQDRKFKECFYGSRDEETSAGRCGLFVKCTYALEYEKIKNDSQSDEEPEFVHLKGHIAYISNPTPYAIDFYYDVVLDAHAKVTKRSGNYTGGNVKQVTHVKVYPGNVYFFDTKTSAPHTISLYYNRKQVIYIDYDGSRLVIPLNESETLKWDDLVMISASKSSTEECPPKLSCRFLNNICNLNSATPSTCYEYDQACHGFSSAEEIGKEYCIADCLNTYWPMPKDLDIDSDLAAEAFAKGFFKKGAKIDGLCKNGPLIVVSLLLCIVLFALAGTCYKLWDYRTAFQNGDGSPGWFDEMTQF